MALPSSSRGGQQLRQSQSSETKKNGEAESSEKEKNGEAEGENSSDAQVLGDALAVAISVSGLAVAPSAAQIKALLFAVGANAIALHASGNNTGAAACTGLRDDTLVPK